MRRAAVTAFVLTVAFLVHSGHLALAGTLPDISGTWYANGDPSKRCRIEQSGRSVTVRNEVGQTAAGSFTDPSTLSTDWGVFNGGRISGTITRNLRRINWSNGTYWVRAPMSDVSTPVPPTPKPTPTPARLSVSVHMQGNEESPIYMYAASLSNNWQHPSSYSQCVSYRNLSHAVATDVEFSFVVTGHSGTTYADFEVTDRGTFTPPVNIDNHCWNGALWPNRVVRLMARETIHVRKVTFADGSTWRSGMPFARRYSNNGSPLVEAPTPTPTPSDKV